MATVSSTAPAATARPRAPDASLFLAAYALTAFGLVMIYSASYVDAAKNFHNPAFYVTRQAIAALLGFCLMLAATYVPLRLVRALAPTALGACLVFLALVLHPGLSRESGEAVRWVKVTSSYSFQPSELAKVVLIAFLALVGELYYQRKIDYPAFIIRSGAATAAVCFLVVAQPDLSTSVIIATSALLVAYMAGARRRELAIAFALGILAFIIVVASHDYMRQRLLAHFPGYRVASLSGDPRYQVNQCERALRAGGLFGAGLCRGRGKFDFVPQCHNDTIVAIIGEELGFLGLITVISIFLWFVARGFSIGWRSPDVFNRLLACGLTATIAVQAGLNLLVVTNILPTTGVPLPFISYGGSSLVCTLLAVGLLLNVSRYTVLPEEGGSRARRDRQRRNRWTRLSRPRHR